MVVRVVMALILVAGSLVDLSGQSAARASRRTASIAGRIIHADGAAAEGARVAVYAMREGAPAAVVATTTSAYDGRYEVAGLPAGQLAVGVMPQRVRNFGGDSRPLSTGPIETFYPGTTDRLKAQPLAVFEGIATEGIDIWLEPTAQRYAISGRVSWPEGMTVENVVIEYGSAEEDVHSGVWYVSDPGGLFTITGASRGTYVLLARADAPGGPLMGIAATDVANDSVQDVRLILRKPGTIEGRVVIEGTGGPDPSSVRLTPTHTLLTPSPLYLPSEATPDGTGRFTMPHLLGEFTIAVNGLPPGWRVRRVTRTGSTLPESRVAVRAEERVTGIEIYIASAR